MKTVPARKGVADLPRFFLLLATIVAALVFGLIRPTFFNVNNLMDILRTSSTVGILALGGTVLMSTGDINFAMGSLATMAASIVGLMMGRMAGGMYPVAILLALAACAVVGALSALVVIRLGVPAFIVTLAVQTVVNGIVKVITNNTTMYFQTWGSLFTAVGQGFLFSVIPIPLVIFAVLGVVLYFATERTRLGRNLFAVGANAVACRQVGINVDKTRIIGFVLCSVLAGVAGIIQASVINTVPLTLGNEMLMPAIASIMLGATFLWPGKYNVPGTIVATVMLVVIQNGIVSVGAPFFFKDIVQGAMLVIAVGVIAVIRKGGLPAVTFGN